MLRWSIAGAALVFLAWPDVQAAESDTVRRAIDRGVRALKEKPPATEGSQRQPIGAAALAGLTLLECGVPADDPTVQKLTDAVRRACPELNHTYSLALAIMLLDRRGEAGDVPLIQSLAVRLLAGQNSAGGWSYYCPTPRDEEVSRLKALLKVRAGKPKAPGEPGQLPKEIQDLLAQIKPSSEDAKNQGDNSNTQFAILGLWVARRHGLPVEKALAQVEARFRKTQNADGGWAYLPTSKEGSTASMSCAGLLGLGMGHGASAKPAGKSKSTLAKDPAIRAALIALSTTIDPTVGKKKEGKAINKGFYFLWSLERVAVAYGLNTIGKKDWYAWGSEILLASQQPDGSWQGEHGREPDTCFALLFLRRANLTQDLSTTLKGLIQDPGEVILKPGGVGGTGLLALKIKSAVGWDDNPAANLAPMKDNLDPEAARLCTELVQAPADQQALLLERLKDTKGVLHTDALAAAIPQLPGPAKAKARDALALRLTRMTAATLRSKLKEDDLELRRAAALACGMKEDKAHVADLIALLDDPEPTVVRAAAVALKNLTGKDFGPAAGASAGDRAKAIAAWKAWYQSSK